MEEKAKFKIIYSKDADDFLNNLPTKIKDKIIYNIAKAKFVIDPELFKKLDDTDIWEFRTFYNKVKYRLLAFWDKDNGTNYYADCEIAWTSFDSAVRKFRWRWYGFLQENNKNKQIRIHPTEKPIALY